MTTIQTIRENLYKLKSVPYKFFDGRPVLFTSPKGLDYGWGPDQIVKIRLTDSKMNFIHKPVVIREVLLDDDAYFDVSVEMVDRWQDHRIKAPLEEASDYGESNVLGGYHAKFTLVLHRYLSPEQIDEKDIIMVGADPEIPDEQLEQYTIDYRKKLWYLEEIPNTSGGVDFYKIYPYNKANSHRITESK